MKWNIFVARDGGKEYNEKAVDLMMAYSKEVVWHGDIPNNAETMMWAFYTIDITIRNLLKFFDSMCAIDAKSVVSIQEILKRNLSFWMES